MVYRGESVRVLTICMPRLSFVLTLLLAACEGAMANMPLESAASVLFERFETVFYAHASLLSEPSVTQTDVRALRIPFAELLDGLHMLGGTAAADVMSSSEAVLVGAREFSRPVGLGSVQSKFCYIVVLASGNAFDVRVHFRVPPNFFVGSTAFWNWPVRASEGHPGPSSLYLTQIKHYLLISSDRSEIEAVSTRLESSDKSGTARVTVWEWQYLAAHEIWGYRRYSSDSIGDKEASGLAGIFPAPQVLTLVADPRKRICSLRFLTSVSDRQARSDLNTRTSIPPLKEMSPGVWETTISLAGDEGTLEQLALVMGLFGFGIYL